MIKNKSKLNYSKFNFKLFILLFFMVIGLTVGFSSPNEELKISSEASFRPNKDIRLTNILLSGTTYNGLSNYQDYSVDSIKIGATLPNLNPSVTYSVYITCNGNISMWIDSIIVEQSNNSM